MVLTSRLPRELMQYFIQLMEVILEQKYQLDLGQSLPKLLEEGNRSDFHALAAPWSPTINDMPLLFQFYQDKLSKY